MIRVASLKLELNIHRIVGIKRFERSVYIIFTVINNEFRLESFVMWNQILVVVDFKIFLNVLEQQNEEIWCHLIEIKKSSKSDFVSIKIYKEENK